MELAAATTRPLRGAFERWADRRLDRCVRPTARIGGRRLSAFRLCGYAGLAVAVPLALLCTRIAGLSPLVAAGLAALAVATFLAVALVTRAIIGEERLTYYHHEIAVLGVAAAVLTALRLPVLGYLDALLLGIGAFLACGRIGCLMVGCCHGRPHRWGVRYGHEHAAAGFAAGYVGVRLFPVQAVEAVWAVCVVSLGAAMIAAGAPPGAALVWYVVAYGLARFLLEFARGDAGRAYWAGFSEAQWTSLVLMAAAVAGGWRGTLPGEPWHAAATGGVAAAMILVAVRRRSARVPLHLLLGAGHLREVADALGRIGAVGGVRVERTSLGVLLSGGAVLAGEKDEAAAAEGEAPARVAHFTLSWPVPGAGRDAVVALASLVRRLRPAMEPWQVIERPPAIVHLVAAASPVAGAGGAAPGLRVSARPDGPGPEE